VLELSVWDHDTFNRNDKLGAASLPLAGVLGRGPWRGRPPVHRGT
jgi:hypothetical protein